jgi:pyruvate carboxylase
LGTFEFLVNPQSQEYYFLEVNPRLQVEHTITESIAMTDIVKAQLLLSQGAALDECGLPKMIRQPLTLPPAHCIQLRITAEDVENNWSLSIGKITSFRLPSGNGIRVDTHLVGGHAAIVSTDFDSLIAKLVVTGSSWQDTVRKAERALEDTQITGVKTNISILRAIVAHPDFINGRCDTQWLESKQKELLPFSRQVDKSRKNALPSLGSTSSSISTNAATSMVLRKGDAWSASISSPSSPQYQGQDSPHHIELTRVLRNEFPASLSVELLFTTPSRLSQKTRQSTRYKITLSSTSASASAVTSQHRRANPSDSSHISIPFPGKLVEVLVDQGDVIKEGHVVCVVQQMKMELEVRSPRSGVVTWVTELEDGEDVSEGMLAAIVESKSGNRL